MAAMFRQTYNLIMDDERNPFNRLPKLVRFRFMLILSYMWSAVFSIWIGSMFSLWPMIVGHTAVIVAIFFTADIFKFARGESSRDYRYLFKDPRDGCARYDDLWGG